VRPQKRTKTALLFYLSLAVILPSYQGFKDGPVFHFFKIFESHAYFDYHSRPEVEAPHDRVRSHASLYFFPSQRFSRDPHNQVADHAFAFIHDEFSLVAREHSGNNVFPEISSSSYICGHKTSGLSPPVI